MKQLFKIANYSDFEKLQSDRLGDSSYKNMAFPLGCSRSEFDLNLDDREISLLDHTGKIIGFVRIKSVMHTHIYLDVFCIDDEEACAKSLKALQNHLMVSYATKKFFVQLLSHETLEQQCLKSNGYEREASLSEHVWQKGAYQDVYIYGSPFYGGSL